MSGVELIRALGVPVYMTDAEGRITFYNKAAAEFWTRGPALGSLWCGSVRLYRADGEPMAHADNAVARSLAAGVDIQGEEAIAERPDGSLVLFRSTVTLLRDSGGRVTGALNLITDLGERQVADHSAIHLAAIVSSSDDAIISKRLDGVITSWNAGAERIFGYSAAEMIGQWIGKIIPPDLIDEEKHIVAKLSRGERVEHYETVRLARDGRRIDISLTVSPLRDVFGRIVGASKVARDVTDRRRAEETQRLLVNELNHRVKNTLAMVRAIASQTLRRTPNPRDFVPTFSGRIDALARAHGLLTSGAFRGADLERLVRDQVLIHPGDRVSIAGPSLTLDAQAALHLALVLHELGANARKHGALSTPDGRVSVTWAIHADGGRELVLDWRESGGPKAAPPHTNGFGAVLIEQSLRAHGGEAVIHYAESGVTCAVRLPLAALDIPPGLAPQPPPSRGARSDLHGKRVLVVEDEALIAMTIAEYLADAGCVVIGPAPSVERGAALIELGGFDAALLDGNLLGKSVDELAVMLTQKGTPFAFVTGYGREALPLGFRDAVIVEKPFSNEQLLAALSSLINPAANVVSLTSQRS